MDHQKLEAFLRVQIAADKLAAYLSFTQVQDDFESNTNELKQYLRSKGVIHGIRDEMLEQICANPIGFYMEQTLIAQGKPSLPGKDGAIQYIADLNDDGGSPSEQEDGKVDFKEVAKLKNVRKGQLIAQIIEPEWGMEGMTVTGESLPPKPGKSARFKVGKNVVQNNEQTALYAAIDGLITLTDNGKINVFPIYEVNGDVDYRVGNIDFVGTVIIRGNVLNGFRVKSAGDIRVIGGVEGAVLESEGSIEITGGIMAKNKGSIYAAQSVRCSFIQDSNIVAGEDVLVSQSIMHSNVKAGKSVVCSGAKGLIVGGVVQAGELVRARNVGNSMSTATVIEVGVNPHLRDKHQQLRESIKQMTESLDKSEKALVLLDQMAAAGQLTPDRLALRVKLNATKRQAVIDIEEAKEQLLEIEKSLEDAVRSRVSVAGTVFGGTKVVIGRYTKFIKDSIQRVSFRYSDGEIVNTPYHP